MRTHNLCFEQKYENYQSFLSENFQFLEVKFSKHLNRHVFVMNKKIINTFQTKKKEALSGAMDYRTSFNETGSCLLIGCLLIF